MMGAADSPQRPGLYDYDIYSSSRPIKKTIKPFANSTLPSQGAAESIAECKQAVRREQRQHDGHWLPEPDRPGESRPAQDDGRKETQLDAVGRAVVDTVAAEAVWW